MEKNPLVSIVVRTKDRPLLLKKALQSISKQTYRPLEVVLVNDGGCDLNIKDILEILRDITLNYIKIEKNMGRANAGNVGLMNAKGKYIGFLDDDDEFYPEHVSTLVSFLQLNNYKVVYTDSFMAYKQYNISTGEYIDLRKEKVFSQDFNYDYLIFENYIPFMCLLFEKEILINCGGFDDDLDIYEDWDLLIRIGEKYPFYHIKQITANYNQWNTELQISQRNKNHDLIKQSYLKVLSKHLNKVTAKRILAYISYLSDKNKEPYINSIEALLSLKENTLEVKETLLAQKETILNDIYNSRGWKALIFCRKIRDKFFPVNSIRRKTAVIMISIFCKSYNFFYNKYKKNKIDENTLKDKKSINIKKIQIMSLQKQEDKIKVIASNSFKKLSKQILIMRNRLFPEGTMRWFFIKILLKITKEPIKVIKSINKTRIKKMFYELKANDLITIEKKIEQKLTEERILNKINKNSTDIKKLSKLPDDGCYFDYLFKMNTKRGEEYVPLSYPILPNIDVNLIAFYLPQFHPIKENDEWWGKGFTEWTNVTRALPQFIGHYQPRLPGELGFYDLRIIDVQKRQVELAKHYGIYGFCFHFYWFNGKRLLETPLKNFSENIEFPFCINWANENWTRRWDGYNNDVLIAQSHSPEDDIAFIKYVSNYLVKRNYIRIKSKPLLVIYRPTLLPNPKETAERWREWCLKNGIGEIYLATVQSFEHIDPRNINFDAAIEFPPNTFPLKDISSQLKIINPNYKGIIYDYKELLDCAINYQAPPYKKFRGICPSWDNEARKPGRGTTLINSSPETYKKWLRIIFDYTVDKFEPEERLIFINAWNEWAESAYLEPDRRYGYAYLQATADALISYYQKKELNQSRWMILFVSHDTYKGGAQTVLLNTISWFKKHTFINFKILCLSGGDLLQNFMELGETLVLNEVEINNIGDEKTVNKLKNFCGGIPDLIYCNSVASGRGYHLLRKLGAPIIMHFHELSMSVKRYAEDWIGDVIKNSKHFIAASDAVGKYLIKNFGVSKTKISIVYSSIEPRNSFQVLTNKEKHEIRKKLGLEDKFLIFGCGLGMAYRKGADLFIDVARILLAKGNKNFHFYWIGNFDKKEYDQRYGTWEKHITKLKKEKLTNFVTFLGFKENPREYIQAGDVFLLSSREEPVGLVGLEAAECGLPIICFADAGGMPYFVGDDAGFVVPYENVNEVVEKIMILMMNKDLCKNLGIKAKEKVLSRFTVNFTMPHTLSICRKVAQKKPAISIIVPNYNHAAYLKERLDSIFNQTIKDFELIILDDASTDNSLEIINQYSDYPDVCILRNEENSGTPFKQWLKGINLSKGDIIWIAESDDSCEPDFLEKLLPAFNDPTIKLAYANSHIINEKSDIIGDYVNGEYLLSLSNNKWKNNYTVSATKEINDGLGVKDTILNISAVLFRKFNISKEFENTIINMKIAGDWYFVVNAIKNGKVYYEAKKLNYHRRHSDSIIGKVITEKKIDIFFKEFSIVQKFIFNNYELDDSFFEKWESYLRKQWNDFCPGKPFEELTRYYPFNDMKEIILSKIDFSKEAIFN